MPTSKDLLDQQLSVWNKMTDLIKKSDRTAEETATYEALDAEWEKLDAEITRTKKYEDRSASSNRVDRSGVVPPERSETGSADSDAAYLSAFRAYLMDGMTGLEPESKALMRGRFQSIKNAAGVGTGAAGGYLVPPEFRDTIIETLKWYGPMLTEAEVVTTNTGADLPWPTNDDTANVGALLAENTAMTEQDVTIGTANIGAYMYTSKMVRASFQLMQDRPDFDTWLARKLGERIGRIWNQHFTTGTGSSQPDGLVTSATVGTTGTGSFATTGGIVYANLVDMVESLDPAYGGGNGLKWMMHQSVRKALRKLVDTQGRPLWEPNVQVGVPPTLLEYPVVLNNDMPTLAASSKSLLFGNVREAYIIRQVKDISTVRLDERYAEYLQVGFFGYARADGTMQNGNAVRVFQTTATA